VLYLEEPQGDDGEDGHAQMRTLVAITMLTIGGQAMAQSPSPPETISIRDGETVPLDNVYWISTATCQSLIKSVPQVEMMEGPPEISLKFEPGKVLALRQNCKKEVDGGRIMATAKGVIQSMGVMLTSRTYHRKGRRASNYDALPRAAVPRSGGRQNAMIDVES
jgi:hypothetical protein